MSAAMKIDVKKAKQLFAEYYESRNFNKDKIRFLGYSHGILDGKEIVVCTSREGLPVSNGLLNDMQCIPKPLMIMDSNYQIKLIKDAEKYLAAV